MVKLWPFEERMGSKFLLLTAALLLTLETVDCAARGRISFYEYYDSSDGCDPWFAGDCDFYFKYVRVKNGYGSTLFYDKYTSTTFDSQTYYPGITATVDLPSDMQVYLSLQVWDEDVRYDDYVRSMSGMAVSFENADIGQYYTRYFYNGGGTLTVKYKLLSCDSRFTGRGCADCVSYYYGSQCSTYCRPISGSYTCDSNGRKNCVGRKTGSSCQYCQSNYYPNGRCTVYCRASSGYTCNSAGDKVCKENYYPSGQCDTFCDPQPTYTCSYLGQRVPVICSAGNYLTETGCQQCGSNTFSSDGASSCTECPDGKISNAGSTSAVDCYYAPCSAGDYMTDTGCQQCGANTFSSDGASSCTECPDGKISNAGSTSAEDCYYAPCSAGDYMTESGCQQCEANTFCGDGASSCTECPDGKISNAGSTSADNCYYAPCSAGDYMTDTGCQQCAANTYSDTGASSCTKCPDGKISNAWSTSADNCYYAPCSAGDYMTDTGCQQCEANTFCGDGASSCTECPDGTISNAGSTSADNCYYAPCSAGDYMTDTGCQQCEANTFCGDGASSCTECPDGKISNAGSTSADNCYYAPCSAGDYMTDTGCQQCGANTFSSDGASSCINLPITTTRTEGAAAEHGLSLLNLKLGLAKAATTSDSDYSTSAELPPLDSTSIPPISSTSPEGPGKVGVFDRNPYPVIDSYPQSKTVRVGEFVDIKCSASDTADHLPNWPKHDLTLSLMYEDEPSRDLSSTKHNWWVDESKSTKSRPSLPNRRIDITEVAEIYVYKSSAEKSDQGWYRCRACIYLGTDLQSCDISLAKFYVKVLKRQGAPDEPNPRRDEQGSSSSSPAVIPTGQPNVNYESPRSSCQVFGDPHFVSFDGAIFNLPGASCDYVMALDQDAGTWFIYGRMRPCGSLAQGVCLESVTIYAGGDAIELQRGWVVNHKGKKIETRDLTKPIKVGEFELEFIGNTLKVTLLLKVEKTHGFRIQSHLVLTWDGLTAVTIEAPQTALTQGLCGNNDQDPANDFDVWGTSNADLLLFSESMKVDRNWKCDAGEPTLTMDQMMELCGTKKFSKAQQRCEKIFATTEFRDCLHDKEPYIDACIYDQCKGIRLQNNLYPWMIIPKIDKVLWPGCNAAEAYAMKCATTTWDEDGNMIALIEMEAWETETRLCPSKEVKKANVPKLGCPQSFM